MEWKTAWKYQTINFGMPVGNASGMTQHLLIKAPIKGNKLRFLLDNRLQHFPMILSNLQLTIKGSHYSVSLNHNSKVLLDAGESAYTDEIPVSISAGDIIEFTMTFEQAIEIKGFCQTWSTEFWHTRFSDGSGNPLDRSEIVPSLKNEAISSSIAIGVSQMEILTTEMVRTLCLFGDSITQMSYYSDALLYRLLSEQSGKAVMINAGISGNRLCYDAPSKFRTLSFFGEAGVKRFGKDVLAHKPDIILMLFGINDITQGFLYQSKNEVPTVDSFCKEYANIIQAAQHHNAKIYIGTILPENAFATEEWYSQSEDLRLSINDWIKTQTLSDGILDFAGATTGSDGVLKDGFHLDHLHPNTDGGKAMANIIPLDEILK